jgi:hypothetical protein
VSKTCKLWLAGVVVLALVASGGCQRKVVDNGVLELEDGVFQATGPYSHENLTVFLLEADEQDDRDYITLDKGLKDGVVKVSEKGEAEVQQLEIDNQSDHYLFLQEGDRVSGGQQDRIIVTSLVVPPRSGKMPLPSFCIEASRWVGGKEFHATSNAALAAKDVRQAAKVDHEQGKVWDSVGGLKRQASSAGGVRAPNTNSSLNETFDSPQVKKLSDEFAQALGDVLKEHPKAVGVAIVVNGKIEEVNIYPSHQLLGKLYPRLLQSYALQAAMTKDKASDAETVTFADIRAFLSEDYDKVKRTSREVNADNRLRLCDQDKKVECQTRYEGKLVHRQWLNKEGMTIQEPSDPRQIQMGDQLPGD